MSAKTPFIKSTISKSIPSFLKDIGIILKELAKGNNTRKISKKHTISRLQV